MFSPMVVGFSCGKIDPEQGSVSGDVSRRPAVHSREPDQFSWVGRLFVLGLPPAAFDRGPVSQSEDCGVELLDGGRIQVCPCVFKILLGLDEVG